MAQIVHPSRLTQLADFFPSTCTIQQRTDVRDSEGQGVPTWAAVAGLSNLPCRISPRNGREVRGREETYAEATHFISLRGVYATIVAKMRAMVGSTAYDVLAAETDGQSAYTRLATRIVT